MKIAILISGPPRFNNDLNSFIANMSGNNTYDWFFYLNNNNQGPDKESSSIGYIPKTWKYFTDVEWAKSKIKSNLPDNHKIADFKIYDHSLVEIPSVLPPSPAQAPTWHQRIWKLHHHWHQVDLMRQAEEERLGEKYDLVIRTRPDSGLKGVINLDEIKRLGYVEVPIENWHGNPSISDIIGIGSSEQMKIYCDLYNYSLKYFQQGRCAYHNESLLAYHLISNNVPYRANGWTYELWNNIVVENNGEKHVAWSNWE